MSRNSPVRLRRLLTRMISGRLKFEHLESRNFLAADAAFWMGFEGETSDRIGVNEGTPQGTIEYIEGPIGLAAKFSGTESINVLKQSGALDFDSSDFTIETWIKADPIQNGVPTLLLHNYGGLSAGLSYYGLGILPSGGLQFDCRDTVGNNVVVGDDAPDAVNLLDVNWHHVAAKREGNTFSIYVDGSLRKAVTQSFGSIHTTTAYVRISGTNTGPSNWTSPITNEPWTNYTGALDELLLYRRALSATEIVDAANPKSVSFAPPVSYSDSGAGYGLGHGDFNQDGIVDLATGNYGTGSLNVFLGQGDGVYGSPTVYSVGGFPSSVAVGDIDGDGKLDLATGTYTGHTLVVLFGNGDGTFGDMRSWSNGFDPVDVKIGDMNNDGRNDVVSANYWNPGGSVTVLLSGAGRTFQAPVDYTANSGTEALVLRDVDGDNDLDVATADYIAGTMSILLNNGSGVLGAPVAYTSGNLPVWIESADFNRDGHSDMAVSNYFGQSVSIFLSNGNGTFQSARQYATGSYAGVLRAGDLNQDGIVDLAISLSTVDSVGVLLGNGDGTFGGLKTFATGDEPAGITIADLDGNGTLDLATANYSSANITVLKNLALPANPHLVVSAPTDAMFGTPFTVTVQVQDESGTPVANFTGAIQFKSSDRFAGLPSTYTFTASDSGVKSFTVNLQTYGAQTVSAVLESDDSIVGSGRITVANPPEVSFGAPAYYSDSGSAYGLSHGDFNQDGFVDLVTANYGTGSLNVFLGQSAGVFGSPVIYPVGGLPTSIAVGDIDGDGKLDLATGTYTGQSLVILFGNGDGTFGDLRSWSNSLGPVEVQIGDMNNDGRMDLVAANYSSLGGSVTVLLGGASGRTFQPPIDYAARIGTEALVLKDLDGDNDLDVATADYFSGTMSILVNNGSGVLSAPLSYASGTQPAWITSGDFNRDGHTDLAVSNYTGMTLSVFIGNGNATFQAAKSYDLDASATVLHADDLNDDGILDLAVSLSSADLVGVLLGNGDGTFRQPTTFPTGDDPRGLIIADLDGNGTLDLATSNYGEGTISVLMNLALPPNTEIGPVEDANSAQDRVFENAALGTAVGVTALAVDPDSGDAVTYTLTNNAGGSLAIDPVTGIVTVAGAIDFEQNSTLTIEVRATSTDGSFSTAVFSLEVIDVIEGITFEGTAGNDTLKFWPAPTAGQFYFKRNAEPNLLFTPTSNVIVNGNGGVDTLIIEGTSGANQFDILADRITFNTVSFYANQVATRQINALGSGDTVQHFGGPANVNGGSAVDKLIAMQPGDHTWTVTGVNAGNLDGQVFFTSVESLIGNAGVDVFNMGAAASLSSIVDGMGGGDLIDYSAVQTSISTNLQSGSSTKTGGIRNIEQIVGSAAVDTLILNNTGNTVEVTGASVGSLSSGLAFAGYENITGGSGVDNFNIGSQGQILGNLNGGGGNDILQFLTSDNLQINLAANTATRVSGSVVSIQQYILGTGIDTVLGRNTASTWVVSGANAVTTSGVIITNVESLVGGSDLDTLTGLAGGSTWELTGADAGALGGLVWNGFENVTGGSGDDTFMFRTGATLSGTLSGGSGADTLDFSTFGQDVTLDLANLSATASSSTVIGRFLSLTTVKGSGGLDTIIGANNTNTWRVTNEGGNVDGLVFQSFETWQGGTVTDTLIGLNAVNQWEITSSNAGSVGNIQFSAFENLTGNSLNDTFAFIGSGILSGTVNGGSGHDTLDFSAVSSAVVVNLATNSASQVGGFVGVEQLIGSLNSDTVIGANAASTWAISASNALNVRGLDFSSFESLVGGAADDTFRALEGTSFLGTVEGGAGSDRLDYGAFASGVSVNLSTGGATGFGEALGIENVTGGLGNDTLIGDSQANVLNGGSGDDILLGMAGDDTINGSNGRDMIIGGTGSDLLHGNNGDDLLIGGSSTYINESSGSVDQVALDALMLEWRRTDSTYAQRVARIRGTTAGGLNGSYYLNALTIIDDLAIDDLWGDANTDWFWAGVGDTLHSTSGEEVN